MQRRLDWRTRLHTWALEQVGLPFLWGRTDCASLARRALCQLFPQDVLTVLPQYSSAREAMDVLQRVGSMDALLRASGAQVRSLAFMQSGDIVVLPHDDAEEGHDVALLVCLDGRECLGVHHGVVDITAVPPRRDGLAYALWEIDHE